jgi:ribosomal protein S18 acetylase RimI-like enzyme
MIHRVNHQIDSVAVQIHCIQMASYAQEARLLGVSHFAPLMRTANDIKQGAETFIAEFSGNQMVGVIGVEPENESICIASTVVLPDFQRRGIAKRLLASVMHDQGGKRLTVQTAAKNIPAIALYLQAGFVQTRRWFVGPESLELVELVRN